MRTALARTAPLAAALAALALAPLAGAAPTANGVTGKGVTWGKEYHDANFGIDRMSCWGGPPTDETTGGCDAYQGDTACSEARPILCVRHDNSPRPNYAVQPCNGCAYEKANYSGWIEGHITATAPIVGDQIRNVKHMNTLCKQSFGEGWTAAKFNSGRWYSGMDKDIYYGAPDWPSTSPWPDDRRGRKGGWGWLAFGNVDETTRYWVITIAQPRAHCFPIGKSDELADLLER